MDASLLADTHLIFITSSVWRCNATEILNIFLVAFILFGLGLQADCRHLQFIYT